VKLAAVKKTRSTAKQVRAKRALKKVADEVDSAAFKQATKLYAIEKAKGGRLGKSCSAICRSVNESFGSEVKDRTVREYVQKRLIGVSPKKRGRIGFLPHEHFTVMVAAAESFITIRQLGRAGAPKRQELRRIANTVANSKTNKACPDRHDDSLIDQILAKLSCEITADTKVDKQEERRVAWTTYSNLNTWFDSWKHHLVVLGFAKVKIADDDAVMMVELEEDDDTLEGEIKVSPSQLRRIVNLDETNISLDGSDGNTGGRPSVVFVNSKHANPGKAVSKAGQGVTMIGGSNAAGEPFPPHFQFPSEAQSKDTKRVHAALVEDMLDVFVQFGHPEKRRLSATVGMNPKGGMDNLKFHKYLLTLVPRLFPDAADVVGKRVMIKCDSGPGRDSLELLADLRVRGIYLFPAVPNSSAVTQEMDQCYGPFKSGVRQNLDILFQDRLQSQINSVGRNDIGMIVFGRKLRSGRILKNVFEALFSVNNNKRSWRKVGAVPLTRACLDDAKVRHEVTIRADGTVVNQEEGGDPLACLYADLERSNKTFVGLLVEWGYERADLFSASVARRDMDKVQERITAPHSQARIDALAAVSTAGGFFMVTGGSHLTADEVFIGGTKRLQGSELKLLKKKKKDSQDFTGREAEAKLILETERDDDTTLKVSELESLLKWKLNVKTLPKDLKVKPDKLAKWIEVKANPDPVSTVEWTQDDQSKLDKFETGDITIEETVLGQKRQEREDELVQYAQSLDGANLGRLMDRLNVEEQSN
jgi:hypothetical protein